MRRTPAGTFLTPCGLVALAAALVLSAGAPVGAQTVTGTILGTVSDNTGGVMPGVTVVTKNTATSLTKSAVTDDKGRFEIRALQIGPYEVSAELEGFKKQVKGVQLTVGSEVALHFTMEVGGVEQNIVVTAEAPVVQTSSTEVGALVDQKQIQQLPLNARDIQQLATLQPGVQSQAAYNGLYGANISVRGSRPEQNSYLLNGVDSTTTFGTSPVSAAGIIMGVEGLQEFKVLTSDYSAAYGVKQGGVVNMVTKAGTNSFHGSVYEFHRDDKLDATGVFEKISKLGKSPLKRDQFGASLGGPIRQGQTFFFVNYEQFRNRVTTTGGAAIVPSEQARAGYWPDSSGNMAYVGWAPQMLGYLNLIPHGNGVQRNDGTAEYFSAPSQKIDERYVTARVDHQLGANNQVWAVYTGDWSTSELPSNNPNFAQFFIRNKQIWSVENVHTFSNVLINSTRVGVNKNYYFDENTAVVPIDKALYVAEDPYSTPSNRGQFPSISLGNPITIGLASGGNAPVWYDHLGLSVATEFTYTKGAHSARAGANFQHSADNGSYTAVQVRGEISFDTFPQFMQGIATRANVLLPGSNPKKNFRSDVASVFVEDSWRASQGLTVTAGVRWDALMSLTEASGQIANLRGTCCPVMVSAPTVGNPVLIAEKTNFAPRLGFNWDVFGDGKTSLRGGGGMFFNLINPFSLRESSNNVPITTQVSLNNVPFPNVWVGYSPSTTPPDFGAIEFKPKTPVLYSYHAALQRELPGRISVTVSYVGSQGRHLPSGTIVNSDWGNRLVPQVVGGEYYWPTGLTRPNPKFGRIGFGEFVLTSSYNAFQAVIERRVATGPSFTANYTWSKCTDDASGELNTALGNGGGPGVLQTSYDLHSGRGRCSFTSTHSANFTTTWDLPGKSLTGIAGAILGGWRWSTIWTVQSGYPFNVTTGRNQSRQSPTSSALGDRPDFAPGFSTSSKIVTGNLPTVDNPNALWFDPTAFVLNRAGYLGNVPARFLTGPGLFTSDWSLSKAFILGGGKRIEVQAQAFNITNHMNFRVPSAGIFTSSGARNVNAGRITSVVTPARQIQLGIKFAF